MNKICCICGGTYPKESKDDVCKSCRRRVDEYKFSPQLNKGKE